MTSPTIQAALLLLALAVPCQAQNNSLFGPTDQRQPLLLQDSSFLYVAVEPPRAIQLHDIVTVVVDERSAVISEGEIDRRKTAQLQATLGEWLRIENGNLKPAVQADGDPTIDADLKSRLRAENSLETADALNFNIAAKVVDIRPNGNLVLEAHRTIKNNEETWEQSLTGIVRPQDILPNNTVFSEDVAELRIHKREMGHVRDGYRRGWFLRFLDKVQPF